MTNKKKPQVDNEQLRTPLLFLGFFIVGSVMTLSFSFKEEVGLVKQDYLQQVKTDVPVEYEVIEEEIDEPALVIKPIEDLPPIAPPSDNVEPIKSKDEDPIIVLPTPVIIDPLPAPKAPPITHYPDVEASFPGGKKALYTFLESEMKYPEYSQQMGDQGRVYVEFIVNVDGSIEQIEILRGVTRELNTEALRVIKKMPSWIPGEVKGEKVRTRFRMPINFILHP